MSIGDLITAIFRRSGLSIKEFAKRAQWSAAHVSHVINGDAPGSLKMLEDCLSVKAGDLSGNIEDYLMLPPLKETEKLEKELLKIYRALSPQHRSDLLYVARSYLGGGRGDHRQPAKP